MSQLPTLTKCGLKCGRVQFGSATAKALRHLLKIQKGAKMITAAEKETTINFKRLDEWVIVMIIDQPCPHGGKCASRIKLTINSLLDEIAQLQQEKTENSLEAGAACKSDESSNGS